MIAPETRQQLDPVLRRLTGDRLYYAYALRGERVGRVDMAVGGVGAPDGAALVGGLWDLVERLHGRGYESPPTFGPIPLEAAKTRADGDGSVHDSSLRRVDPDHPTRQFHIHLFVDGNTIDVHSHYELRPDLKPVADESWTEASARAREHLSPSWGPEWGDGTTYVPGRADETVRGLVR